MSTRSFQPGDAYGFSFTFTDATGALANATAISSTLYRNGVADAAVVVTVANSATGIYQATCTIPGTYAVGDRVSLYVQATAGTVTTGDFVDHIRLVGYPNNALPNQPAGNVGGLLTYGSGVGQVNPALGNVVVGDYAAGKDPAAQILTTPSQKIYTDASGNVRLIGPVQVDFAQSTAAAQVANTVGLALQNMTKVLFDTSSYVQANAMVLPNPAPTGYGGTGGAGSDYGLVHSGTCTGGGVNTITLAGTANTLSQIYRGNIIYQNNQTRTITNYDGATRIATVDENWQQNPSAGITAYEIRKARNPSLNASLQVATAGGAGGAVTLDFTQTVPGSPTPNTVGAAMANAAKISLDATGNVGLKAGAITSTVFATGAITAAAHAAGAIDANAFAQGAADKVWASIGRSLTSFTFATQNDFTQALPTSPAAGTFGAAALAASKLGFDASNNVNAIVKTYQSGQDPATLVWAAGTKTLTAFAFNVTVGGYATGQAPNTLILTNPTNKLLTDASGFVTPTATGAATDWTATEREMIRYALGIDGTQTPTTAAHRLAGIMAILNKFMFDVSNNVKAMLNAYGTGLSPGEQVLFNPTNKVQADGTGRVFPTAADLAPTAFDAITVDGMTYLQAYKEIMSACGGEITYDPATLSGSVSRMGNPAVARMTFKTDANFLSRTQVALTPDA